MADNEQKGQQFIEEAEKKLKSSKGFFGSFSRPANVRFYSFSLF